MFGIRWVPLNLVQSYLHNRVQQTLVNGSISKVALVTYGALQGSVLGPLLFLEYINDLRKSLTFFYASLCRRHIYTIFHANTAIK